MPHSPWWLTPLCLLPRHMLLMLLLLGPLLLLLLAC
jgi:hypothetical protein